MMTISNINELDRLQPPLVVDENYMLLPIKRGFNWKECFVNVDLASNLPNLPTCVQCVDEQAHSHLRRLLGNTRDKKGR